MAIRLVLTTAIGVGRASTRSSPSWRSGNERTSNFERPARPQPDPLGRALARYVEALHRRYPEGLEQLRREGLDARAKVSRMIRTTKDPAA